MADVVDEDVDTPVALEDGRRQPIDVLWITHVDHDRLCPMPGIGDGSDPLPRQVVVDLGDHHVSTGCGEGLGDGAADAAASPGDDGHLAGEIDLTAHLGRSISSDV